MRSSSATRPVPLSFSSATVHEPAERLQWSSGAWVAVKIERAQVRRGRQPVGAPFRAHARGSASVSQRTLRFRIRGSLSSFHCWAVRFRFDAARNDRDSKQRPPFRSNHQTDSLVRVFFSRFVARRARSTCSLHTSFQYAVRTRSGSRLGAHCASSSPVVCSRIRAAQAREVAQRYQWHRSFRTRRQSTRGSCRTIETCCRAVGRKSASTICRACTTIFELPRKRSVSE